MTKGLRLQHGLLHGQIPQAAGLYWQAFGTKLGRLLGPDDKALAFFVRAIRPDLCLAALTDEGQLCALLGMTDADGGFAGGKPGDLVQVYGAFGAWWRGAIMAALPRDENPGRFLIDGLCVDARWRGQGIGSRLLDAAEAMAIQQGFTEIQIDVAEENHSAKRLYLSRGYRQVNRKPTGALRWIFRTSATLTLVKSL